MRSLLLSVAALALLGGWGRGVSAAEKQALPATVRVSLPADAALTVDGHRTTSTSAARWFVTPALERDQDFQYTFKAQVVRDGRTLTREAAVYVRAGQETVVTFDAPEAGSWAGSGVIPASARSADRGGSVVPASSALPDLTFRPSFPASFGFGEGVAPRWTYSPYLGTNVRADEAAGARVAPFSEQSPVRDAGATNSNAPLAAQRMR
jgi:uncharacterized protein (TIGR03000 family)